VPERSALITSTATPCLRCYEFLLRLLLICDEVYAAHEQLYRAQRVLLPAPFMTLPARRLHGAHRHAAIPAQNARMMKIHAAFMRAGTLPRLPPLHASKRVHAPPASAIADGASRLLGEGGAQVLPQRRPRRPSAPDTA